MPRKPKSKEPAQQARTLAFLPRSLFVIGEGRGRFKHFVADTDAPRLIAQMGVVNAYRTVGEYRLVKSFQIILKPESKEAKWKHPTKSPLKSGSARSKTT